jgi:hypothetical protein
MLSILMQVFMVFALIIVLWCIYGYSLAFTEGNAFFGKFDRLFLNGIWDPAKARSRRRHLQQGRGDSEFVYVAFQATFAAITCGLIVGAFAERAKFTAVLAFVVLWFTFAYLPWPTWSGSGPVLTRSRMPPPATEGQSRLPVPERRAGLRRRHRGAHQRRRGRPGGRLHDRQTRRLRPRIDGAALADHDHDRRFAAVGGLVRFQRRFGTGSGDVAAWPSSTPCWQRLPPCRGCSASGSSKASHRCWAALPVRWPAWWPSPRRAASSVRWAR